jgi:putative ABC transport system permease protein
MTFRDTLALAFRNLRQSRLRTALTTMGVAIGIASLSGMVSLGVGLQEQVVGRLTQSGVFDSITVTGGGGPLAAFGGRGGSTGGRNGRGGRGGRSASGVQAPPLDDEAVGRFSQLTHVRDVYPNLRVPVRLSLEGTELTTTAAGVPESSRNEGAYQDMAHGAFFDIGAADVCLLSLSMAGQVSDADPSTLVGRTVTISWAAAGVSAGDGGQVIAQRVDRTFTIVGIVERDPTAGAPAGFAGVMIPLAQARDIHASLPGGAQSLFQAAPSTRTYASVTVKVQGAQYTQDVQDAIKALGYSAFSLNDALQGAKRAFLLLDIILGLVGSIALAVSSLGIVNTMVMSILERTREIGIMKAIGGGDGDVRRIFLVEASVIGVLGGAAGLVLGWGCGRLINVGANWYIESQGGNAGDLFSLPWWLIAGSMLFALLVSLAAGAYPARRAARLDPIQALRHE